MEKVLTHTFHGVRYDIDIEPIEGFTQDPNPKVYHPALRVINGLPFGNKRGAKKGLETLIHESLHAENFNTREQTVERIAREIANLLWRLGYRRVK